MVEECGRYGPTRLTSLPVPHTSRYFWATWRLPECFKNESAPWRHLYTLRSITVRSWSSALSNAPFLRLMTQTGPRYVIIKIRLYLDKPILHHRHICQLFYRHKFTPLQSPYAPYLNKYCITKTYFFFVSSPRNRSGLNTLLTPLYVNNELPGNAFQTA